MKALISIFVLSFAIMLTGCSHVTVGNYHATADNVQKLKDFGVKFNVNEFTAKKTDYGIHCRLAGPMEMPNGESFKKYIENAFVEELKKAGMYSENSPIIINGHLNDVDASSGITDAHWTFDITISSNNKSFTVIHKREYRSSFSGMTACQDNMPRAFVPTVEELIAKILNHPEFESLVYSQMKQANN
jgi:hypothetical protein